MCVIGLTAVAIIQQSQFLETLLWFVGHYPESVILSALEEKQRLGFRSIETNGCHTNRNRRLLNFQTGKGER